MILDLSALYSSENREEVKEVHIDMESFVSKLGVFPILKSSPFVLHLASRENRHLFIQGEADLEIALPCDRCLTDVPTKFHLVIEKNIAPQETEPEASGREYDDEDHLEQLEYVDGHRLDIDRLVYTELLTAWPMKVLCRDDCKGICSKCGADLNKTACNCDRTAIDPRMAAFQDVFNKFKEV